MSLIIRTGLPSDEPGRHIGTQARNFGETCIKSRRSPNLNQNESDMFMLKIKMDEGMPINTVVFPKSKRNCVVVVVNSEPRMRCI